jgi:hypothetical protein
MFGNKNNIIEGRSKKDRKYIADHLKEITNNLNPLEAKFSKK